MPKFFIYIGLLIIGIVIFSTGVYLYFYGDNNQSQVPFKENIINNQELINNQEENNKEIEENEIEKKEENTFSKVFYAIIMVISIVIVLFAIIMGVIIINNGTCYVTRSSEAYYGSIFTIISQSLFVLMELGSFFIIKGKNSLVIIFGVQILSFIIDCYHMIILIKEIIKLNKFREADILNLNKN